MATSLSLSRLRSSSTSLRRCTVPGPFSHFLLSPSLLWIFYVRSSNNFRLGAPQEEYEGCSGITPGVRACPTNNLDCSDVTWLYGSLQACLLPSISFFPFQGLVSWFPLSMTCFGVFSSLFHDLLLILNSVRSVIHFLQVYPYVVLGLPRYLGHPRQHPRQRTPPDSHYP